MKTKKEREYGFVSQRFCFVCSYFKFIILLKMVKQDLTSDFSSF